MSNMLTRRAIIAKLLGSSTNNVPAVEPTVLVKVFAIVGGHKIDYVSLGPGLEIDTTVDPPVLKITGFS